MNDGLSNRLKADPLTRTGESTSGTLKTFHWAFYPPSQRVHYRSWTMAKTDGFRRPRNEANLTESLRSVCFILKLFSEVMQFLTFYYKKKFLPVRCFQVAQTRSDAHIDFGALMITVDDGGQISSIYPT